MTGKKLQYCVILNSSGKVTDMKVSNGKWIASLNGKAVEDLTIDDLENGNLDDYNCGSNEPSNPDNPNYINCTFDGDMVQGAEYVNGQYTYRYKQEGKPASSGLAWQNITSDGWGVQLTDKASTDAVNSEVCTYINNKPITSMSYMFYKSQATTLDLSNFDTSKVTNMSVMFSYSHATTLDVSNFDTSNVTSMNAMFNSSINLKTIYVSDKFKTGKVTSSNYMFSGSTALVGGAGTKYDSTKIDKTYARIDTASTPGYFTKK